MMLRSVAVRPVVSMSLLLFLCLALPAGNAHAKLLDLIIPAVLAKKQWTAPQLIETGTGQAGEPQVAMDGAGNALAVWQQGGGIWAAWYR